MLRDPDPGAETEFYNKKVESGSIKNYLDLQYNPGLFSDNFVQVTRLKKVFFPHFYFYSIHNYILTKAGLQSFLLLFDNLFRKCQTSYISTKAKQSYCVHTHRMLKLKALLFQQKLSNLRTLFFC